MDCVRVRSDSSHSSGTGASSPRRSCLSAASTVHKTPVLPICVAWNSSFAFCKRRTCFQKLRAEDSEEDRRRTACWQARRRDRASIRLCLSSWLTQASCLGSTFHPLPHSTGVCKAVVARRTSSHHG